MQNTLIDAGPLIALFDKDDRYHEIVKQFLRDYTGRLITTWPVITEASHLLDFNIRAQIALLEWLHREAVQIIHLDGEHIRRLIRLAEKYADLPMDLADGTLLVVAEMMDIRQIITIDSDYAVYRIKQKQRVVNVLDSGLMFRKK